MLNQQVMRIEKVGTSKTLKLTRSGRRYQVLSIRRATPHLLSLSTVKWTFKRAEVARLAFEFVVATEQYLHCLAQGSPSPRLLRTVEWASKRLKSAMKRYDDYPPESGGR